MPLVFTFSRAFTPLLTFGFFFGDSGSSLLTCFFEEVAISGMDEVAAMMASVRAFSNRARYVVNGVKLRELDYKRQYFTDS